MRIAKHILYYLSVPAAIVLWLGGYLLLDALIFSFRELRVLVRRDSFHIRLFLRRSAVRHLYSDALFDAAVVSRPVRRGGNPPHPPADAVGRLSAQVRLSG